MGGVDTTKIQLSSEKFFTKKKLVSVGYDGDSGDGRRHNTDDVYEWQQSIVKKEGEAWQVALGDMSLEDTFQYKSRSDAIYNLFRKGTPSEKIFTILSRIGKGTSPVKDEIQTLFENKETEYEERLRTWLETFRENPIFSYLDPKIRKQIHEAISSGQVSYLRPQDIEKGLNEVKEDIQKIENGGLVTPYFGGYFKTYGKRAHSSYLVLEADGNTRPPDLVYLSGRKHGGWKDDATDIAKVLGEDGYPTGKDEAYWKGITPGELPIKLSREKEGAPWQCEYYQGEMPTSLTEEQKRALKKFQLRRDYEDPSKEMSPREPKSPVKDPSTQTPFADLNNLMGRRK